MEVTTPILVNSKPVKRNDALVMEHGTVIDIDEVNEVEGDDEEAPPPHQEHHRAQAEVPGEQVPAPTPAATPVECRATHRLLPPPTLAPRELRHCCCCCFPHGRRLPRN